MFYRPTAVVRLGEKGEGSKQTIKIKANKETKTLIDTDNSMVITRGEEGGGRQKRVKGK